MIRKSIVRGLWVLAVVAMAAVAQADNINLASFGNVTWNPTTTPGGISENIQIENQAASANEVFSGYDLGLGFTLVSGSGKLAVSSYANPASNAAADFGSLPNFGATFDVGAGFGIQAGNSSNTSSNFSVGTSPVNLLNVTIGAGSVTPSAGSEFDVWGSGATNGEENNGGFSDYEDNQGDVFPFANTGAVVNTEGDVLLGTITIAGAVPEPSSLVLLGAAALGLMGYFIRRRSLAA